MTPPPATPTPSPASSGNDDTRHDHDLPHCGGWILFEFVDEDCQACHKAPAEIDGLCITCDHLQDDLRIDSKPPTGG